MAGSESSDEAISDSSAVSVTVTLDFDPVEFQATVKEAIILYESVADAYFQWRLFPEPLKLKLHAKLDKTLLNLEEEKPLSPWSSQELDDFRDEARMKIIINAFDKFQEANPSWIKDPNALWMSGHTLRMDMRGLVFRLESIMTKLSLWAKKSEDSPKVTPRKLPLHRVSLITFTFTTNVAGQKQCRSLQLLGPNASKRFSAQGNTVPIEQDAKDVDVNLNVEDSPIISFAVSSTCGFLQDSGSDSGQNNQNVTKPKQSKMNLLAESQTFDFAALVDDDLQSCEQSQIFNYDPPQKDKILDSNVNEVFKKRRGRSSGNLRKSGTLKKSEDDRNANTDSSWITISESSSKEEVPSSEDKKEDQQSYSRDDLETAGVKGQSEVRGGSRVMLCIFCGAIFVTIFVTSVCATLLSLYKVYLG